MDLVVRISRRAIPFQRLQISAVLPLYPIVAARPIFVPRICRGRHSFKAVKGMHDDPTFKTQVTGRVQELDERVAIGGTELENGKWTATAIGELAQNRVHV